MQPQTLLRRRLREGAVPQMSQMKCDVNASGASDVRRCVHELAPKPAQRPIGIGPPEGDPAPGWNDRTPASTNLLLADPGSGHRSCGGVHQAAVALAASLAGLSPAAPTATTRKLYVLKRSRPFTSIRFLPVSAISSQPVSSVGSPSVWYNL